MPGYRDHFWVWNLYYDWNVYAPFGSVPMLGAYADTNDLLDPCRQQTMSIGLGYPGNIGSSYGYADLTITIESLRGALSADSIVSGVIDAVDRYSCDGFPWYGTPSTDCMGLDLQASYPGAGPDFYVTLNQDRGARAAGACWNTTLDPQWLPDGTYDNVWMWDC